MQMHFQRHFSSHKHLLFVQKHVRRRWQETMQLSRNAKLSSRSAEHCGTFASLNWRKAASLLVIPTGQKAHIHLLLLPAPSCQNPPALSPRKLLEFNIARAKANIFLLPFFGKRLESYEACTGQHGEGARGSEESIIKGARGVYVGTVLLPVPI